jgi:hypothetical protein
LDSKISKKTYQILANVRESGFETERKFIHQLEKYGITSKNFGKDSGFTTLVVKTVADLFAPETQTVPANIRTFL